MRILDQESTETITLKHFEEAREQMIIARETHLNALGERLKDFLPDMPTLAKVLLFYPVFLPLQLATYSCKENFG